MADVAQLVERRFVVPVVAGSIPVVRPSQSLVFSGECSESSGRFARRRLVAASVCLTHD